MSYLETLNDVNLIEWGKTYSWDIKFKHAPYPFNKWFPAIDVEEEFFTVESHVYEIATSSFKVPKSLGPESIRITFHDDIKNTLLYWLEEWVKGGIFSAGYVRTIKDPSVSRPVSIQRLDSKRNQLSLGNYYVYPEGTLAFIGNSESAIRTYSLSFVITQTLST